MSEAQFQVIYDGPALHDSAYNVRELSSSLAALDKLFESASEAVNPAKTKQTLFVRGSFESGSFKVNLTTSVSKIDAVKDWLLSDTAQAFIAANDLLSAVIGGITTYGLIQLVRFLKGGRPTKVHENEDGTFKIYRHESFVKVEQVVWHLYNDFRTRKALEATVSVPLEQGKVETIAFNYAGSKDFTVIDVTEKEYFVAPEMEREDVNLQRHTVYVSLIKVSFRSGNKWTVFDGANTLNVTVEDEVFLKDVDDGAVLFGKGDRLKALLRIEQFDIDGALRTEYFIEKVEEHTHPEFKGQKPLL